MTSTPIHLPLRSADEVERTLLAAALQYGGAIAHLEQSAVGSLSHDQAIVDHAEAQLRLAALTYFHIKNAPAQHLPVGPLIRPGNLVGDEDNFDDGDFDEMFAHP